MTWEVSTVYCLLSTVYCLLSTVYCLSTVYPRYEVAGHWKIQCLQSGQWDYSLPECKQSDCTVLPPLQNGFISSQHFSQGKIYQAQHSICITCLNYPVFFTFFPPSTRITSKFDCSCEYMVTMVTSTASTGTRYQPCLRRYQIPALPPQVPALLPQVCTRWTIRMPPGLLYKY